MIDRAKALLAGLLTIGLLLTGCSSGVANGGAADGGTSGAASERSVKVKETFRIGDQLKVKVTKVQTGLKKVGAAKAQGRYVSVTLAVENVGSEPDSLGSTSMSLVDDKGNTYKDDLAAFIGGNRSGASAEVDVNPGAKAGAKYYFDIKKGAKPKTLILTPSFGMDDSKQIRVSLG